MNKESSLLPTKNLWEHVFHAVPGLIAIIDTEHRIVHANKAMADRLGLAPEALCGRKCYEVVHDRKEPLQYCPHTKLLKDGKGHSFESFEKNLKGFFDISVSPIFDDTGKLIGSIHVARDITKRKEAEEALQYPYKIGGWEIGSGPTLVVVDQGMASSFTTTTAKSGVYAFFQPERLDGRPWAAGF